MKFCVQELFQLVCHLGCIAAGDSHIINIDKHIDETGPDFVNKE